MSSTYWTLANIGTALQAPLATALKLTTGGLLNPRVYQRLNQVARTLPDLPFVEIGAASGTGTVALALGYARSSKRSPIVAVEKCQGGTRVDYGGYRDNLARLERNLRRFGVRRHVLLYPRQLHEHSLPELEPLLGSRGLAGFLHDADGRLDRDFELFWERVVPGGLIVVDDYANRPQFQHVSERSPDGGTKHVLTYELLNVLIDTGHFQPEEQIGDTVFGRKPAQSPARAFPTAELAEAREDVWQRRRTALAQAR